MIFLSELTHFNLQGRAKMEALTAAFATALTIYDMCIAGGKEIVIGPTMLLHKNWWEVR